MLLVKAAAFILTTLLISTFGAELPPDFKRCHLNDPNLNECFKSAIQEAFPKLKDGVKELGLPPIEPLIIPSVEIGEGSSAVRFTQRFTDFKIYNSINSKVVDVKLDLNPKQFKLELETANDETKFVTKYNISGKILVFPISGNGNGVIRLQKLKFKCIINGVTIEKDGKKYINVTDVKVNTSVGGMVMEFDNLFDGNEELGKQINQALNENWEVIYKELQASYETIFGEVYKDYMNKVFSKVPFDQLFLP